MNIRFVQGEKCRRQPAFKPTSRQLMAPLRAACATQCYALARLLNNATNPWHVCGLLIDAPFRGFTDRAIADIYRCHRSYFCGLSGQQKIAFLQFLRGQIIRYYATGDSEARRRNLPSPCWHNHAPTTVGASLKSAISPCLAASSGFVDFGIFTMHLLVHN